MLRSVRHRDPGGFTSSRQAARSLGKVCTHGGHRVGSERGQSVSIGRADDLGQRGQQALRQPACAQGHQPGRGPRPGDRRAGTVGLRQIDVVPHHQSARAHRLGHDRDRRRRAARRRTQARAAALRRRHGVSVVQSVRAQDNSAERRARPHEGAQSLQGRGAQEGDGAAGSGRHRQPGGEVPGTAIGRPAAAGGDRPIAGDEPEGDAVRRAHQRAGPGDDQRGAERDDRRWPRTE